MHVQPIWLPRKLAISSQEIQQELNSHEGALETIRLQAYKLLQGIGGCHVNAAAIHSKLDNTARRWDHLEKLAKERYVVGCGLHDLPSWVVVLHDLGGAASYIQALPHFRRACVDHYLSGWSVSLLFKDLNGAHDSQVKQYDVI